MADGTLIFDTSFDTTGVNNAEKTITSSLKRMKSKLKAAFGMDIVDKETRKVTAMQKRYDDATAAVDRQKNKVQELRAEIEKIQAQSGAGGSATPEEAKPLYAQADELAAKIEQAKAKAREYGEQWRQGLGGADTEQMNWLEKASRLEAEYDEVLAKIEKIEQKTKSKGGSEKNTAKMEKLNAQLVDAEAKLTQLSDTASTAKSNLNNALDEKKTSRFSKSVKNAEKSTHRFTKRIKELAKSALIFSVLTKVLTALRDSFGNVLKSNEQFSTSWANIKGNLLTAFQPIYEACLPALLSLMQMLEKVTAALASFTAAIFGTSVSQMQANAKALRSQAKATKEAGKAAKDASRSLASFDEINQLSDNDSDSASSATIEPSFDTNISELDGNMAKIAAYGSVLVGTALLIFGICTVNIPAILTGIGLIAAGFMVGANTGAFDGIKNFLSNAKNSLLIGMGLLIFGLLTLNIFAITTGFKLLQIGISQGKKTGAFDAISAFLNNTKRNIIQWGIDVTNWLVANILPMLTKEFWLEKADNIKQGVSEKWTEIKTWFSSNVAPNFTKDYWLNKFNSVKQGFTGKWTEIKDWFNTNVSPMFTKKYWTDKFSSMKEGAKSAINGIIACFERGINGMITRMNNVGFTLPDWLGDKWGGKHFGVSIPTVSLPRLASGTVVPANYGEFQAILGDNKREVEVVSPLSTMKQAFIEAMEESGNKGGAPMIIYLMMNNKVVGQAAIEYHNGVVAQTGVTPLKGV